MNRIHRSIWNARTGSVVAVAETTRAAAKGTAAGASGAPAAGSFRVHALTAALAVAFAGTARAEPTGGAVVSGSARIGGSPASMVVTQTTDRVAINWQSFNVRAGESVTFVQPGSSSVALNRVVGADPSTILGSLSANGKVFLVNPNGILFGRGASVNVGGLVASTLAIGDAEFMAGDHRFAGNGTGSVVNAGTITARDGGYVALLGARVGNDGVISARLGTIAMAAGRAVTLDVAGDRLLHVAVDQGAVDALARNGGLLRADGGLVLMTTQAAGSLLANAVNNTGVVQAQTIESRGGTIKLLGGLQVGEVMVGGTLDAGAPTGGTAASWKRRPRTSGCRTPPASAPQRRSAAPEPGCSTPSTSPSPPSTATSPAPSWEASSPART